MAPDTRKIRIPLQAYLEADLEVGQDATGYTVTARKRRVVVLDNFGGEFASVNLPDATVAAGERFAAAAAGIAVEVRGSITRNGS